jgi:oligopeptide/dipeptide ABC transporter ATP-binding protein
MTKEVKMPTILKVEGLKKHFKVSTSFFSREKAILRAVDGISFNIDEGEVFALVGESGCGKTTTGKLILRLFEPTAGTAYFMNKNIFEVSKKELFTLRKEMQIIFQDPYSTLNPRKNIRKTLSQPLTTHNIVKNDEVESEVLRLLNMVGLCPGENFIDRYGHELSGGQRQRIGIARAIASRPRFIVADEPLSALDLSIQAQIINLFKDLIKKVNLSCLFITHDLSVVRSISNRVAVMYLGKIVELASTKGLYNNPLHPYTNGLLSAIPVMDPIVARSRKKNLVKGEPVSAINPPTGCRFHTRCEHARDVCSKEEPGLEDIGGKHFVSCHLYDHEF